MHHAEDIADEQRLIRQWRAGNTHALATIFKRYYPRLYRDACRFVSADVAEDVVQDVFATIVTRRHKLVIQTTLRQYLHAAVRNRVRDIMSRVRVEQNARQRYTAIVKTDALTSITPERQVLVDELTHLLIRAVAQCSTRSQEALRLAEKYPLYTDIAREMQVARSSVHTLLLRSRRKIRAFLAGTGYEDLLTIRATLRIIAKPANRRRQITLSSSV